MTPYTMKAYSARLPADVAERLEAAVREPGDMSRFIRSAIVRALNERDRKRQARRPGGRGRAAGRAA